SDRRRLVTGDARPEQPGDRNRRDDADDRDDDQQLDQGETLLVTNLHDSKLLENVMWPRLESLVPPGHCLRGTPDGTATGMPRLRQTVCCVQHILIQQVATRKILSLARKAAKKTPTDKICQPHTVADCQEELGGTGRARRPPSRARMAPRSSH